MSRPAPRLHRLPHRTDYILIPAPLDLSLPLATEKSALPAIIVTPSSPSSTRDFSIAFLAAPPKPSLKQRFEAYKHFHSPGLLRFRAFLILLFMFFILVCHLVTHRMAISSPYLEFSTQAGSGSGSVGDGSGHGHGNGNGQLDGHHHGHGRWFDFRMMLGGDVPLPPQVHRKQDIAAHRHEAIAVAFDASESDTDAPVADTLE